MIHLTSYQKNYKWKKGIGYYSPNILHCYFKGTPAQRGHRKRFIEIWTESAKFYSSQSIAELGTMVFLEMFIPLAWNTRNMLTKNVKNMNKCLSDGKLTKKTGQFCSNACLIFLKSVFYS